VSRWVRDFRRCDW